MREQPDSGQWVIHHNGEPLLTVDGDYWDALREAELRELTHEGGFDTTYGWCSMIYLNAGISIDPVEP